MIKPILQTIRPGEMPFKQAEELQIETARKLAAGDIPDTLILLEHTHTYSFGRQGNKDNLLWSKEQILASGVDLVWTDRGGDITYHGPGQLVGYPILKLGESGTIDIHEYLRNLEEVLITSLAEIGIKAVRVVGETGVWIPEKEGEPPAKIASIGVKIDSNGISRHGFALNVCPDMSFWDGIIACGLENQNKTSIREQLSDLPSTEMVSFSIEQIFLDIFNYQTSN